VRLAFVQMAALRAKALDSLARVDLLLVPSALTHWTQGMDVMGLQATISS
jgi:hypothetical protein